MRDKRLFILNYTFIYHVESAKKFIISIGSNR